jgi:hypothetical protein
LSFYYLIAIDPCWDGLSSFGNRKFISLLPFFVIGLAVALSEFAGSLKKSKEMAIGASVVAVFVIWNLAFIFQWGTHLVPARGPISWKEMAYNQVVIVPKRAVTDVKAYLENRRGMMKQIEVEDLEQQQKQMKAGAGK